MLPFQALRALVAVDSDDQHITELLCLPQEMHVPGMQDVEDTIGKHNRAPSLAFDIELGDQSL